MVSLDRHVKMISLLVNLFTILVKGVPFDIKEPIGLNFLIN